MPSHFLKQDKNPLCYGPPPPHIFFFLKTYVAVSDANTQTAKFETNIT